MTSLPVLVSQDYVTIDKDDWIRAIGDLDDTLTESLQDWLSYHDGDVEGYYRGYANPNTEHIVRWAGVRFRADDRSKRYADGWWNMCTGMYGEDGPWEMHTYNTGDHLFDEEFGAVWFYAPDGPLLFIETADRFGCYTQPSVYRVKVSDECLTMPSATGECVNGHGWGIESDGIHLHDEDGGNRERIDEHIRQIGTRYYVACPYCSKGVRFHVSMY